VHRDPRRCARGGGVPLSYLEEAADLLRQARDANEKRAEHADGWEGTGANTGALLADVNARRLEIAAAFTRLAEIQAGGSDG
jgi:hypothetical protein